MIHQTSPENLIETAPNLAGEPGVFSIPEAKPDDGSRDEKAGAILSTWGDDDHDAGGTEDTDDLPMIVWLRGDEPWFAQFTLDAQAVMEQLGIKRSRLTQISGKELRVGRVRVERYIKPVYRVNDVATYLSWTRATASHQKSSSALKEAADTLHIQSQQMALVVSEATENFSNALKDGLLHDLEAAATRATESLANHVLELKGTVVKSVGELRGDIDRNVHLMATQSAAQEMHIDSLESTLAAVNLRFSEVSAKQSQLLEDQTAIQKTLALLTDALIKQDARLEALTKTQAKAFKPARRVVHKWKLATVSLPSASKSTPSKKKRPRVR